MRIRDLLLVTSDVLRLQGFMHYASIGTNANIQYNNSDTTDFLVCFYQTIICCYAVLSWFEGLQKECLNDKL